MTVNWNKIGLFAAGLLTGTAGIKLLTSKDAKKAYAHATAAVLRGKDSVMKTYTTAKENAGDILAEAKDINARREAAAEEEIIEDGCEDFAEEAEEETAEEETYEEE